MLIVFGDRWMLRDELVTPRLVLREHRPSDLDDLVLFHADPGITRYIPWPVRNRAETAAALAVKVRQTIARDGEWLVLAVVHVGHQKVIGEALLKRRGAFEAEIGYVLSRLYQGAGYASEAVGALIDEAYRGLGVTRLTAVVDAGNAASVRLLRRLGFVSDGGADETSGMINLSLGLPRPVSPGTTGG